MTSGTKADIAQLKEEYGISDTAWSGTTDTEGLYSQWTGTGIPQTY